MQTEHQTRQLSLHDYLSIIDRRKWVIIEATIVAAAVAFFVSFSQAKVFTAAAEVLLARQTIATSVAGVTSPDFARRPRSIRADTGRARPLAGGGRARTGSRQGLEPHGGGVPA